MDGKDRPCASCGDARWYVIHVVQPPADVFVINILKHFGIEVYQFTELRKRKRLKPLRVALFPGYIFVCFDVKQEVWRTIHEIPGVIRLMSSSPETPIALPDGELEQLIEDHRLGALGVGSREKLELLVKGTIMRVVEGPFTSFPATIEKDRGEDVDASVTIFGQMTPVTFKRAALEKV